MKESGTKNYFIFYLKKYFTTLVVGPRGRHWNQGRKMFARRYGFYKATNEINITHTHRHWMDKETNGVYYVLISIYCEKSQEKEGVAIFKWRHKDNSVVSRIFGQQSIISQIVNGYLVDLRKSY